MPSETAAVLDRFAVCRRELTGAVEVQLPAARLESCHACGSWTYLPRPSAEAQVARHDSEAYATHPYFETRRGARAALDRRCARTFATIGRATDLAALRGQRVLDAGCDTGAFLAAAARRFGIVPVGIDVSRTAIARAAEAGIEAHRTSLEAAPVQLRDFPLITAIDLLEHVTDPGAFLRAARERLRDGGLLYLETPNIASTVYATGRMLGRALNGRRSGLVERLFPPEHVQYFTPASLRALAAASGFQVVSVTTRILPFADLATSLPVRGSLMVLQLKDVLWRQAILICALLRR